MKKVYLSSFYVIVLLITLFGVYACKNRQTKYASPSGYDLEKPDRFNMPSSLLEISGIAFHNGKNDTVYSIQDEDGKLFRQAWDVKKQKNMKFSSKGDYEDVSIFKDMVFVLKSNGSLYSFPISEAVKAESDQVKERKKIVPKGEYEGLFADAENNKLYILCKNCEVDKKKKHLTGYALNYDAAIDSILSIDTFKVDLNQLKAINVELKSSFRPSALAKNPKTKEWFIVSSVNKMLLVTDEKWNIKKVYYLSSSIFNQPEGIAFDNDLNLYISNEGDELTDGNILKFKYSPLSKQ